MRAISREFGAEFVGSTLHYFHRDPIRDKLNGELRSFFEREGIAYFDADREMPKEDSSVNTDEVHFTRPGCERMADGYLATLAPLIAAHSAKPSRQRPGDAVPD